VVNEAKKEIEPEDIPAEGESQKCAICHEELDKYYDQDREEWMLRKAVKKDGRFYHLICAPVVLGKRKIKDDEL
jgi:pre-mRNA cleavage complex 2 protein Pcf11